jgi:predicted nucleotidyltransferase
MRTITQLNLRENERKALQKLKDKLLQRFPDTEIILYGSKAREDYEKIMKNFQILTY